MVTCDQMNFIPCDQQNPHPLENLPIDYQVIVFPDPMVEDPEAKGVLLRHTIQ